MNKNNQEIFVCNGRHYHDYDTALNCFIKTKNSTFFFANLVIDGQNSIIFYAKSNSFDWDLLWKSNSWNNNQWALNRVHRSIHTKSNLNKPIIEPLDPTIEDITNKDKHNITIKELRKIYLKETNRFRTIHAVPNLILNSVIEKRAQLWAESLAKKGICKSASGMCHEKDSAYGENIAVVTHQYIQYPISIWYNEIKYFNFTSFKLIPSVLHFTQLIWKGTKQMGCGISRDKNTKYFIVCKYHPPGNIKGLARWNVPRAKK
ncbi:CAP domain-containing protein [Strongyloides ratti]|nr:CAP domain-containing protein [Strongyloides ratti]CEF66132.1 CAP domain-containing protein [Strongyloides ratti]